MTPSNDSERPVSVASGVFTGLMAVILLSGLLTIYLGARMLVADISSYQVESFVSDWFSRGKLPSEKAWLIAHRAAERSLQFYPADNGAYYEDLGIIHEWRHYFLPLGDPRAYSSRNSALDAYRIAIELRPFWPYTWARLAVTKMKLLEFDEEFDLALRNSITYGPWRSDVNYLIAEMGLAFWVELSPNQKLLICQVLQRMMVHTPKQAGKLIAHSETMTLSDFYRYCPKTE